MSCRYIIRPDGLLPEASVLFEHPVWTLPCARHCISRAGTCCKLYINRLDSILSLAAERYSGASGCAILWLVPTGALAGLPILL